MVPARQDPFRLYNPPFHGHRAEHDLQHVRMSIGLFNQLIAVFHRDQIINAKTCSVPIDEQCCLIFIHSSDVDVVVTAKVSNSRSN